MAKKDQETVREGLDLDAAYRADGDGDPEHAAATGPSAETLPPEDADTDEPDGGGAPSSNPDDEDAGGQAPATQAAEEDDGLGDLDMDLMDIFSEEQVEADNSASELAEFLEDLTMEQVSTEANRLLDEFRAI